MADMVTLETYREMENKKNKRIAELEQQNEQLTVSYETLKLHDQEEIGMLNSKIAGLEQQISTLLSCKDCPENKGGLICSKEYDNKCRAQKIEYIKELKEEIEEMKKYEEFLNEKHLSGDFRNWLNRQSNS